MTEKEGVEVSGLTLLPAGPMPQLQQVARGCVWASWGIPILHFLMEGKHCVQHHLKSRHR